MKMNNYNRTLDVCSGSRMMYFDKQDERVIFGDKRHETKGIKNGMV